MSWLAALTGIVKLVGLIAEYLGRKQLLDAGAAQAIAEGQRATLDTLAKVKASREALADPDTGRADRLRDKYTRE